MTDIEINNLVFDSRKIEQNDVFFAQKGYTVDGHLYINKAIELGATVIICQELPQDIKIGITYLQVAAVDTCLAIMAANFYENPSSKMRLIGITCPY